MNVNPDFTMTTIKMILSLIVVLVFVMALYYLAKRFTQNPIKNDNEDTIKILSNKYLGIKKNLCLIEIPGSILLLGLTSDKITCLTKIEDIEILEKIKSEHQPNHKSFASHLHKISSNIFQK